MEDNIFEKDYKLYLTGFFIILVLPFINFQPWLSPPAWGKIIIFRIIISLFLYLFLYRIIVERKYSIFKELARNKIILLLLGLALLYISATIFSLNPHFSFWGSPLRAGGSLNYISYIFFAILAFLVVKKEDWQKLWDLSFVVGLLVTFVAVLQKLNIFHSFIIPRTDRAIGTMGGAPFLALYLCLLLFMALSFGIKSSGRKRVFYFFSSAVFLLGVILSGSKGAILAVGISLLFYGLFYPSKKVKWIRLACAACLIILLLAIFGISKSPALIEKIENNNIIGNAFHRIWSPMAIIFSNENISFKEAGFTIFHDRLSTWIISINALKERPLLGFGPENFSIAFDRYFDNSLPGYENEEWWDRAHNFIFDISVTAGIPALIVFLALFGFLLHKLQRNKDAINHGIQATLIAYLINNLFNFDVFSTYLLLFLTIAYALSIVSKSLNLNKNNLPEGEDNPLKSVAFVMAFIVLIFFIWFGALKPLWINKEINVALNEIKTGKKEKAIKTMENILTEKSVIRNYTLLQFAEILNISISAPPLPTAETKIILVEKELKALEESMILRPNYTRTWWASNIYSNYLIEAVGDPSYKEKAVQFCEKAFQLSPGRWKTSKDCANTYLLIEDFHKAKEKADKCIAANPKAGICWFKKALANIALEELEEAEKNLSESKQRNYPRMTDYSEFTQLAWFYNNLSEHTKDPSVKIYAYEEMVKAYRTAADNYLKTLGQENPQYHAYLARTYKKMGDMENAKREAEIVLKLMPEQTQSIDNFLKNL